MKKRKFIFNIFASNKEGVKAVLRVKVKGPWLALDTCNIEKMDSFFPEVLHEINVATKENANLARFMFGELPPAYRSGLKRE